MAIFNCFQLKAIVVATLILSSFSPATTTEFIQRPHYDLQNFHNFTPTDTGSSFFSTSKTPLLWTPSNHVFGTGRNMITFAVKISSPCDSLTQLLSRVNGTFSGPHAKVRQTHIDQCKTEFTSQVVSKFDFCKPVSKANIFAEPSSHAKTYKPVTPISSSSWLGVGAAVAVGAVAAIGVGAVTAITAVASLGLAVFNSFKIYHVESSVEQMQQGFEQQIKGLKGLDNFSRQAHNETVKVIKKLANKVSEAEVDRMASEEFVLLAGKLNTYISQTGATADTFMYEFTNGHVFHTFGTLFPKVNLCPNLTCASIEHFNGDSCERDKDGMVTFKITAPLTNPDIEIYQAIPFDFFLPKSDDPNLICKFTFAGTTHALHNNGNKCVTPLPNVRESIKGEVVYTIAPEHCPASNSNNAAFMNSYKLTNCQPVQESYQFFTYQLTADNLVVYCNRMMLILPDKEATINCGNQLYFFPINTTLAVFDPFLNQTSTISIFNTRVNSYGILSPKSLLIDKINYQLAHPKMTGEDSIDFSRIDKVMREWGESSSIFDKLFSFYENLKPQSSKDFIIFALFSIIVLFIVAIVCYCWCCHRQNKVHSSKSSKIPMKELDQ